MLLPRVGAVIFVAAHLGLLLPRTANTKIPEVCVVSLLASNVTRGDPSGTGPRLKIRATIHNIDVLKRQCLTLVDDEVGQSGGSRIASEKDEPKGIADAIVRQGCQKTDENWDHVSLRTKG